MLTSIPLTLFIQQARTATLFWAFSHSLHQITSNAITMQFFLAALAMSALAQAAPTNRRDVGSIVDTAVGATQDGTNNVVNTTETLVDGVNKNK